MREVSAPLKLDTLDDDTAIYRGADVVKVEQRGFMGTVEGEMHWPVVMIPRSAYEDLGSPPVLMVKLELVQVDV